jgi:hypothetical protein
MTRHPLDPIAFVGGALFTVLGVFALFGGDASRLNAGWIWPATIAVVGLALMAVTARSTVVRQRREHDAPELVPETSGDSFSTTEAEPLPPTDD